MIVPGMCIKVVDGTGVLEARCIKVLGNKRTGFAVSGDLIIVVIRRYSLYTGYLTDVKKKKRFMKGRKFRALVLRTKKALVRGVGIWFSFGENAIILVNKRGVPLSRRIKGPALFEGLRKYPAIGSIMHYVI